MLRMSVTRQVRAKLPTLAGFSPAFWNDVADIVIGGILANIAGQRTADGGRIKVNAPSTRERKRRHGQPLLSLVDLHHRLVRSGDASWTVQRFLPNGTGIVIGPADDMVADISRWVQEAGYTGWIGISAKARAAIKARLRQELKALVAAGARGAA